MKFTDEIINELDLDNVHDFVRLIVEYLCGERYLCKEHFARWLQSERFGKDKDLLESLLQNANKNGLNYEQFNELLLLLNQDRVSRGFFKKFFFGKDIVSLEELRKGVVDFRGLAMLCFGNFRFAYKKLIQKTEEELKKVHRWYCREPGDIAEEYKRPKKMLRVKPIKREQTWYLGNISTRKLEKEYGIVQRLVSCLRKKKKLPFKVSRKEILQLTGKYLDMQDVMLKAEQKALENTEIYLTWDYMDVYIATSMRNKWEFEEAYDFIKKVFGNREVQALHLRYFDPTQSKCKNRIDKGLVEGLMLKRVECCIYMAQESETMGKDSELAATLAQGKPVVAYVPIIDIDEYSLRIKKYPLDYFEKRLLILQAEEIFADEKCVAQLRGYDDKYGDKIGSFLKSLDDYRSEQPLTLWEKKEEKFKKECEDFPCICKVLAIAEHYNFEKRADVLKKYHPLAIQVDLKFGVANGVLVVRNEKECAELLLRILKNKLEFTIKHRGKADKGVTVLEEDITACPFRVVTDDEKLTNSFWNFYLTSD